MEEIILLIFGDDRTTLNSKAQILVYIATTHDKEWYSKYTSIRKPTNSKKPYSLNNDLVYVIQERNVFAHRYLTTSDEIDGNPVPNNVLRFVKFKNDLERLDYTDEKLSELYYLIIKICAHFIEKVKGLELFESF